MKKEENGNIKEKEVFRKDKEQEQNLKTKQTNIQYSRKKKDSNLIAIGISVILAIIVVLCYKFIIVKDNSQEKYKELPNDNKEITVDENYSLNVYKDANDFFCKEKSDYCNDLAFIIKTEIDDAKILAFDSSSKHFVLYEDNGLKIYNIDTQEKKKISLKNAYNDYTIISQDDKIYGIVYSNLISTKVGYYNIQTDNIMYDNIYNNIYFVNDTYLGAYNENGAVLLENNKEQVLNDYPKNLDNLVVGEFEFNSKKFYIINPEVEGTPYAIYDNNKKLLTRNLNYFNYSIYEGYLYVSIDNSVKKYDVNGNTVSSISLSDVKQVINNHVIYVKNDYLNIMNIDNEENKEIVKLDNKYRYSTMSNYYTKDDLIASGDFSKEEGYYLELFYKNGQDNNGNYGIEYCLTKDGALKTYYIEHMEGGLAKPVIYLYPSKETKVTIKFMHPEYLTTTYPKYKDKWEIIASPNGDLKDKDNKYYYALYFDEVRYKEVDFQEGFYVTKNDAIQFLEEKLSIIGLNDKERNEFIMYWLPILEKNEKSLVYFELTDMRELNNKLIINPKPDSLLRIAIHIKKVTKEISIKEQKLSSFKRMGFSVVEWGGMVY